MNKERLGNLEEIRTNLSKARAKGKFTVFANLFVFELMRGMIGDANFLPVLLLEPEWIKDFCQVCLDHFRNHYEILFQEDGLPDGFWIYEDFGYSNGLFAHLKY